MSDMVVSSDRPMSVDEASRTLDKFVRKRSRGLACSIDPATLERLRRMAEGMAEDTREAKMA